MYLICVWFCRHENRQDRQPDIAGANCSFIYVFIFHQSPKVFFSIHYFILVTVLIIDKFIFKWSIFLKYWNFDWNNDICGKIRKASKFLGFDFDLLHPKD